MKGELTYIETQLELFRKQGCAKSKLFAFWDQCLQLAELLLSHIRADQDGDWQLSLDTIAAIIAITAAASHVNYAKDLPRYLRDMRVLPETAPEVHT